MGKVIEEFLVEGGELWSEVDKKDLVELVRVILENNYFEFNGETFRQNGHCSWN